MDKAARSVQSALPEVGSHRDLLNDFVVLSPGLLRLRYPDADSLDLKQSILTRDRSGHRITKSFSRQDYKGSQVGVQGFWKSLLELTTLGTRTILGKVAPGIRCSARLLLPL
ncbi:unnamed protein product [Amoebophrya sp. A25]|nr:unnamed protein product [Amoebophrya sp. A25]|eukprot:GSA25T00009782001.1